MKRLEEKGIETRPFFVPMHLLPMHSGGEKLPVAEELARKGLNLPSSVKIEKDSIKHICLMIRNLNLNFKREFS